MVTLTFDLVTFKWFYAYSNSGTYTRQWWLGGPEVFKTVKQIDQKHSVSPFKT